MGVNRNILFCNILIIFVLSPCQFRSARILFFPIIISFIIHTEDIDT